MSERLEKHWPVTTEIKAIDLLAQELPRPRGELKRIMQKGAVWLTRKGGTRRLRRAKSPLRPGDTLHAYLDPAVLAQEPLPAELIADEGRYSIWSKPSGMLSQGSKWGDHTTLGRVAERQLQPERPAFVVHRLDRAASGLILLAHRKRTAAAFSELLRTRQLEKRYRVWVHGAIPPEREQRLDAPLEGKEAITHYRCLEATETRSHLEVRIETGRKHQIRRHLSESGFPLVGDRLYGPGGDAEDLQLRACLLAFTDPEDGSQRRYAL